MSYKCPQSYSTLQMHTQKKQNNTKHKSKKIKQIKAQNVIHIL